MRTQQREGRSRSSALLQEHSSNLSSPTSSLVRTLHSLASLETLPASCRLCRSWALPHASPQQPSHLQKAIPQHPRARGAEEQHVPEGSSGSSTAEMPLDLLRASPGPCLHVQSHQ